MNAFSFIAGAAGILATAIAIWELTARLKKNKRSGPLTRTSFAVRSRITSRPLKVFVSSRMTSELQWARKAARTAFADSQFYSPWIFEESPASSEAPIEHCLRHVRDSDFVVLLIGSDTTNAVCAEVHEALTHRIPLLVFLFPAEHRTSEAQTLIAEVGQQATWKKVRSKTDFHRQLDQAIADELALAVRSGHHRMRLTTRRARLEELGRVSRARCINRWLATGLPYSLATELTDDHSVGDWSQALYSHPEQSLNILVGELGTGKSLFADRLFQRAIGEANSSFGSQIPIFLEAKEVRTTIEQCALAACEGLGDPRQLGVLLIVDGIDALGAKGAHDLVSEARVLASKWPRSTVFLTSRPLSGVKEAPECFWVPGLNDAQIVDLLGMVKGDEVQSSYLLSLPQHLRTAIDRPLFSLLLGVWMAENPGRPTSLGTLLVFLAGSATGRARDLSDQVEQALKKLGVLLIERGEQGVPKSEIATGLLLGSVLDTGLVTEQSGKLSFPLLLLAHWFASQSLFDGIPAPASLVSRIDMLERWREPLAIFVNLAGFDQASKYLQTLVKQFPGRASGILHDSISHWAAGTREHIGSPLDCGRKLRSAYLCWLEGLGALGRRIGPVSSEGDLLPLAIRAAQSEDRFEMAWYKGSDIRDEVSHLPPEQHVFSSSDEWEGGGYYSTHAEASWPWQWALKEVSTYLEMLLERRNLPVSNGPLLEEAVWYKVCSMLGRSTLCGDPIPLDEIPLFKSAPDDAFLGAQQAPWLTLGQLRQTVTSLREAGTTHLLPPLPYPDLLPSAGRRSVRIWNLFSSECMRVRASEVILKAHIAYRQIVELWFPRIGPHMRTAATLPGRIVGLLRHSPGSTSLSDCPTGYWYLEPVSQSEEISVDIGLSDERLTRDHATSDLLYKELIRERPQASEWLSFVRHGFAASLLLHEHPVTNLTYSLLWDDLEELHFVSGHYHWNY